MRTEADERAPCFALPSQKILSEVLFLRIDPRRPKRQSNNISTHPESTSGLSCAKKAEAMMKQMASSEDSSRTSSAISLFLRLASSGKYTSGSSDHLEAPLALPTSTSPMRARSGWCPTCLRAAKGTTARACRKRMEATVRSDAEPQNKPVTHANALRVWAPAPPCARGSSPPKPQR